MYQPTHASDLRYRQLVLGAIVSWLVIGTLLLLTGLVPAYTAVAGWSLTFWLVPAPLSMLLALEPGLPRLLLARGLTRRRALRATAWN